ncbi:MAG TPA: bifunctional phosphoribosylaminoimidazolecarboxamide formyltransferase/IMP cyclohydrolase [Thermoplasmata archaeon]|nr:bifunctional phosphoribosylaminoimidazolecarboxamide formyltransferase/IMP cyclohydrolase [Thermoplasmata archaeon]
MVSPRHALLSVWDKEGLLEFARGLGALGFAFFASEGTAKTLKAAGLAVQTVSEYTGQPEGLGGRVKTLHPRIFAGILAPRGDEPELAAWGAVPLDLVVANLYPFESVTAKPDVPMAEAIENIDIGGVSLIRAAAKNAGRVGVVVRPVRYPEILEAYRKGGSLPAKLREDLALEAFEYTSRYDVAIYNFLARRQGHTLPPSLRLAYEKAADMRYGENPYQQAAFYRDPHAPRPNVASLEQLHGRALSYNNIADLEAALRIASEFQETAAVIIKHGNPSGVAVRPEISRAYAEAHSADERSAYGCVVGLNRAVDLETAKGMKGHFVEAIIAPDYHEDALARLRKRENIRLVRTNLPLRPSPELEMVKVSGGMLVQTSQYPEIKPETFKTVTKNRASPEDVRDIVFGMQVSKYVKSNSIVLVKNRVTVGMGAGQMSRVDSVILACLKAGPRAAGSVLVSDAFFPFRDGIDEAAKGGVRVIAQPGGSIRDQEAIDACNEHGIAMVFTGMRLFRH